MGFSLKKRKHIVEALKDKYGGNCTYCGVIMRPHGNNGRSLTIDHITPKSDGGSNELYNLCLACHTCNTRRNSKPYLNFISEVNRQ